MNKKIKGFNVVTGCFLLLMLLSTTLLNGKEEKVTVPPMQEIEKSFGDTVRGIVPLFESDVRGVEMLGRVAGALFTN